MSAQSEARLIQAVHDYLDQAWQDEQDGDRGSWPLELEQLTGWKNPDPLA